MRKFRNRVFFLLSVAQAFWVGAHTAFSSIELQPHQKISLQYLLDHPNQKGILLYHSLGSGKTYIALAYAEKNPDKKVLILLPQFLKSNWITQMESFGVKDKSRYEMVSIEEPEKLLNYDLSNTIVIVDEVHKLIQKIRLSNGETSERLISIYQKVRSAQKLLILTGTPIFVDTSDIAYIANLLVDQDLYPVDPVKFKTEFMKIKPTTSLVRGHVMESKLVQVGFPFIVTLGAVVTLGTALPWAIPLVALGGSAVIPLANELTPVSQVVFREFDTEKWKDFSRKYISYYHVNFSDNENYPKREFNERKVLYSDPQANFFLSFVDEDLNVDQLRTMLLENGTSYTDSYLRFHSSRLQKLLLANSSSGLEIGNLEFQGEGNTIIESPKFVEILKLLKTNPGQVAVYSNFSTNGLQRFARFLERHGFKDQYVILSPEQPVEIQTGKIEEYNKALKRILLIHPEITEGISLIGTEQFHILEPIRNPTLLEQIVGRGVRYKSHIHLPKERRMVRVYLWESDVEYSKMLIPTSAGLLRREHWQKNYSEVNPSMWTKGILEVDNNYFLKDETPDRRIKRHKSAIQKDVESLRELLEKHSIESTL